ncbi:MAG TPA: hypothetical protein IAB63_04470 [Candidatus Onthocola gallistercoris]|uniref:HEAT repeat domain-containing protein n=1 Tax=Candidatus Onthocola gallistercoris TaxID=2840876 RepID=A0A9D1HFD8_9FIRM|nr:hypothetical protein [Candidatus Onthocola gallistercoris]
MSGFVDKVIYFYIFICIALLLFNIFYILRRKDQKNRREKRTGKWRNRLKKNDVSLKQLNRTEELMAWNSAVFGEESLLSEEEKRIYLIKKRQDLLELAWDYRRHGAMERAFFAYILKEYAYYDREGCAAFAGPLLAYLEDSTVFCRENVLQALYALGEAGPIGKAFDLMGSRGWYHNPRLISDGLMNCPGDKEKLAGYLWERRKRWPEAFGVAVVQFATGVSAGFSERFYRALQEKDEPMDVRFALIRYFRKYPDEQAGGYMRALLEDGESDSSSLAIAAASALASYPGGATKSALKQALSSRDWYVRRNAALSLKILGIDEQDIRQIEAGGDRYAIEMIGYIAGKEVGKA